LLSNFGPNVLVRRVKIAQFPVELVDIIEGELVGRQALHARKDVSQPSLLDGLEANEESETRPLTSYRFEGRLNRVGNYRDPTALRDLAEIDFATSPSGPPSPWAQRGARNDGEGGEYSAVDRG
jgi:hypothetical protein